MSSGVFEPVSKELASSSEHDPVTSSAGDVSSDSLTLQTNCLRDLAWSRLRASHEQEHTRWHYSTTRIFHSGKYRVLSDIFDAEADVSGIIGSKVCLPFRFSLFFTLRVPGRCASNIWMHAAPKMNSQTCPRGTFSLSHPPTATWDRPNSSQGIPTKPAIRSASHHVQFWACLISSLWRAAAKKPEVRLLGGGAPMILGDSFFSCYLEKVPPNLLSGPVITTPWRRASTLNTYSVVSMS